MFNDIENYRKEGGKVFLFIPDFEAGLDIFFKVCSQYYQMAFCARQTKLLFLINDMKDIVFYLWRWKNKLTQEHCPIQYIEKSAVPLEQLMEHVDYFITGEGFSNLTFLDIAYRKDVKILSSIQKDIFKNISLDSTKIDIKTRIENMVGTQLLQKYSVKEYQYILFHQGLGETTCFFYLLKEYKQRINKKILVLAFDKTRISFLEECPDIDQLVEISPIIFDYMAIYLADQYGMKNMLELHFLPKTLSYHLEPRKNPESMLGALKSFLGIDPAFKLKKDVTCISFEKIEFSTKLFQQMQLKMGKTVFLIMDGISVSRSDLSIDFWKNLIEAIKGKGYEVVIKSDREIIAGIPFTVLPPIETAVFAGLCGNVVSVSTGILDVIGAFARNNVKIQRIMANEKSMMWRDNVVSWWIDILPLMQYDEMSFVDGLLRTIGYYQGEIWNDNVSIENYIDDGNKDHLISRIIGEMEA